MSERPESPIAEKRGKKKEEEEKLENTLSDQCESRKSTDEATAQIPTFGERSEPAGRRSLFEQRTGFGLSC